MPKLTEKVALVTGGSRGIGAPKSKRSTTNKANHAYSCHRKWTSELA